MHTYQYINGRYEVGYWQPLPSLATWMCVKTFGNHSDAARFANYMNGGDGADFLDMED